MTIHQPTFAVPAMTRRRRPLVWIGVIAVVALIGGLVAWNNGLRDALIPKNFGVVEPGRLYRSGQLSRWQVRRVLADNHIARIVCMTGRGGRPADVAAEVAAAADLHVRRDVYPLGGDGTGQVQQYVNAVSAVAAAERAGQPVLVHCVAGAQRTGGVIALYEMLVERRPAAEVYAQLRQFGHDPHDNPHLLAYPERPHGRDRRRPSSRRDDRPSADPAADARRPGDVGLIGDRRMRRQRSGAAARPRPASAGGSQLAPAG